VLLQNVYEGIDVLYYGNADSLEYDFIVRPGADPGRFDWRSIIRRRWMRMAIAK
jgi:hypothetical protein